MSLPDGVSMKKASRSNSNQRAAPVDVYAEVLQQEAETNNSARCRRLAQVLP